MACWPTNRATIPSRSWNSKKLLVVTACGGNTGWHHLIFRAEIYAPHLSNYAGAAGGRSFPCAAGFHTSKTFFTDDEGVYVLDNRDAPASAERQPDGSIDFDAVIADVRKRIHKLQDRRLGVPQQVPYMEAHNTWAVNGPGTLSPWFPSPISPSTCCWPFATSFRTEQSSGTTSMAARSRGLRNSSTS